MCYIFAHLYFLLISCQGVLIIRTTEYSDQCLPRLSFTLQSEAVGGQVVRVADPPPAVVAAPEAVPGGWGAQALLEAVRLRLGCLCGRWTVLEKHRKQSDSIRAEATSYLCCFLSRLPQPLARWPPLGLSHGFLLHSDSPAPNWQSGNTLWKIDTNAVRVN